MPTTIRESDWKILRDLKPELLDRLCQRILDEVTAVASDPDQAAHAKYLKIFRLIESRDEDVANAFNDLKRSNALFKLATMEHLGLINRDELARFSQETHDFLATIKSLGS